LIAGPILYVNVPPCKIALHSLSREKEQNLVLDKCWRGTLAFKTREVKKYVNFYIF
jgi:hypothetical protein